MERKEEVAIIKITKVFYDDQPSHWECDVYNSIDKDMGGGTGPTFAGVYDMAYDIISGGSDFDSVPNDWIDFDANRR